VRLVVACIGSHAGIEAEPGDAPEVRSVSFARPADGWKLNPGDRITVEGRLVIRHRGPWPELGTPAWLELCVEGARVVRQGQ
jgi:hypothetical protein